MSRHSQQAAPETAAQAAPATALDATPVAGGPPPHDFDPLFHSAAMQGVAHVARLAARASIPVLLLGESGVGKEVVARHIHAHSRRRDRPFVAVNCGALPESMIESLLFGHERGAFTGALARSEGKFGAADGGTLFLDELGELSPAAQVKLLRVLQEREIDRLGAAAPTAVDVRLIAATNSDLDDAMRRGAFRADLFYRVGAFPIRVPPLRDRPEDVAPLAERLLADLARQDDLPPAALTPAALAMLRAAPWPGNVRELRNALHRALVMADGGPITPFHLDAEDPAQCFSAPLRAMAAPDASGATAPADDRTLAQVEAEHIARVMAACGDRPAEAARRLGIGRSTLYRKLGELGLGPKGR
jgi:DNA-binding NtrC family response regulator